MRRRSTVPRSPPGRGFSVLRASEPPSTLVLPVRSASGLPPEDGCKCPGWNRMEEKGNPMRGLAQPNLRNTTQKLKGEAQRSVTQNGRRGGFGTHVFGRQSEYLTAVTNAQNCRGVEEIFRA